MNRKPSQLPPNGLDVKKIPQLMSFALMIMPIQVMKNQVQKVE